MKTFEKVLYGNSINTLDLNVELLMFANKYEIIPLCDMCSLHLGLSITREEVLNVLHAAFLTKDERLFNIGVDFIKKNLGTFTEDDDWKIFMGNNPECSTKILQILMFQKK